MKHLLLIIAIAVINSLSSMIVNAQAPQAIPYQAVARDAAGNLIASQNISLRISIRDALAGGMVFYTETHSVTTNTLGLFTVNIGQGAPVTGTFAAINWDSGPKFTQVEMDATGGSSYIDMGTQQMLSVPYALYAASGGTAYTGGTGINVAGTAITNTAPDQTVTLTGTGATAVTGIYPNFTINSTDNNTTYTGGSGINVAGTVITNTSPDQTVNLTGSGATSITGTYPNFTINSTDNNTTYTGGSGINVAGTVITNTSPDQTVNLTGSGSTTVTGTYPNFNISSTNAAETDPQVGSSIANKVPHWNGTALVDGIITDNGTKASVSGNFGIGSTNPNSKLEVDGGAVFGFPGWGTAPMYGAIFLGIVGINNNNPSANLDINGSIIVGSNGTAITNIIKATVNADVPSMTGGNSGSVTVSVPNAVPGSAVVISPSSLLSSGLSIYANVILFDTVTITVVNGSTLTKDPPAMDYYITVIK